MAWSHLPSERRFQADRNGGVCRTTRRPFCRSSWRITRISSPGIRSTTRSRGGGCSSPVRWRSPANRTGRVDGPSTTCFLTRTPSPRWSRSSEAPTPASAAKSSVRCSTTPPMRSPTGPLRRSRPSSRAGARRTGDDPDAELCRLPGRRSGRIGVLAAGENEPPGGAGPLALHRRRDPARVEAGRGVPQQPDGPG